MTITDAKRIVGEMFVYMTTKSDGASKWYMYGKFSSKEAVIAEAERLVAEKRKNQTCPTPPTDTPSPSRFAL
jgi:hypothetical protein